jgi:L-fuculose-phosphate aldolase
MLEQFVKAGRDLASEGLIHSTAGNMSMRKGDLIYITRHGSHMGDLKYSDVAKVNLLNDKKDVQADASVEIKVHRAIYNFDPEVSAIIHAHPPYGIVLSFDSEKIKCIDCEGQFYLPEVPVLLQCAETIGSECVEENLPRLISRNKVAVIRGHGVFSCGKSLEEAFSYISVLESACQIIYLDRLLRK